MLYKERRISHGREYRFVYKNGRRYVGKILILFVIRTRSREKRFGIVTSKKIGKAVTRNKAKRQIREVIRKNWKELPTGIDCVVVARYTVKESDFGQIEMDFLRLMRKASQQ